MHKLDAEKRRGNGKDQPDMMHYYYVDRPY